VPPRSSGPSPKEKRLAACLDGVARAAGHADRHEPLKDYCKGLLLPGGARNEVCTVATIPRGTQQVHLFLVWVFHFSAFCQQNPADPA